jgi:tol-pal system-associated acyl-CoA thioesterase
MPTFWLPVRVYLEDTDAQRVVYNASYFRFMERARTDWLRERGIDHVGAVQDHGVAFMLTSVEARFIAPARLGEQLMISADVAEISGVRATFAQQVRRDSADGELLAEGRAEVACIDQDSGRPRRWPADLLERMQS